MKKLFLVLTLLVISSNYIYALSWDKCIKRYSKAKEFSDNTRLLYIYLKSTRTCIVKFKDSLIQNPDPEFSVDSMNDNIVMLDRNINAIIPKYNYPKNNLEEIPKYKDINTTPIYNEDYTYIKKFKDCNGIHANNKIYTAKHCNIDNSKNSHYDLNYIETDKVSKLKLSKLDLSKKGTFKYYSMSKEGMFYSILLKEKNCQFYKAKNEPTGLNTTLDLTDLTKEIEIRSNCLAIPSNSGGGVFQDGKLVAIISKTVFNKDEFSYSVVEPIIPLFQEELASLK
jgi:hypothetical protein